VPLTPLLCFSYSFNNLTPFFAVVHSFRMHITSASLLVALSTAASATPVYLSPPQDIVLPSSDSAKEPLKWLGANSPWFAGELSFLGHT
jgi:hypothetical protein